MSGSVRWAELPAAVREMVEKHTGPVTSTTEGGVGVSTDVRLVLRTAGGVVFIKGTGPDADDLARERLALGAALAPFVTAVSPPLLFHVVADGWEVTGWPALPGRPSASLAPGSPDLPKITGLLRKLSHIPAPDVPLRSVEEYWGLHDAPGLLDGDSLVHVDPHGANFVVNGDRVWLVDFGWGMRGPSWMTAARLMPFMIEAGWKPADAEQALMEVPAWAEAPPDAVSAFAVATAEGWERMLRKRPDNQHRRMWRDITRAWADHREQAGSRF